MLAIKCLIVKDARKVASGSDPRNFVRLNFKWPRVTSIYPISIMVGQISAIDPRERISINSHGLEIE